MERKFDELKVLIQQARENQEAVIQQNRNCTFDTFEVNTNNFEAYASCLVVAEMPERAANNLLYIYGAANKEKVHLLKAIENYITENTPQRKVKHINADRFVAEVIWALRSGKDMVEFREIYNNYDVFLLDDIQYLGDKESCLREFFYIINTVVANDKQVVVTADCLPRELLGFDNKIISRFEWGNVVNIS